MREDTVVFVNDGCNSTYLAINALQKSVPCRVFPYTLEDFNKRSWMETKQEFQQLKCVCLLVSQEFSWIKRKAKALYKQLRSVCPITPLIWLIPFDQRASDCDFDTPDDKNVHIIVSGGEYDLDILMIRMKSYFPKPSRQIR